MTTEGWRKHILEAVDESRAGDSDALDLLVRHLAEVDAGRARLANEGVSWTGEKFSQLVERLIAEGR